MESKGVLVKDFRKYANGTNNHKQKNTDRVCRIRMTKAIERFQIQGRYEDALPIFIFLGYDYYVSKIGLNNGYPLNENNIVALGAFLYFYEKLAQSQKTVLKPGPASWILYYLVTYKGPEIRKELFDCYQLGSDKEIHNSMKWLFETARFGIIIANSKKKIEEKARELKDKKIETRELENFETKIFSNVKARKKRKKCTRIKKSINRAFKSVFSCTQ